MKDVEITTKDVLIQLELKVSQLARAELNNAVLKRRIDELESINSSLDSELNAIIQLTKSGKNKKDKEKKVE